MSYRHQYIDEWLRVVKLLWSGESVTFEGEYFTLGGYASNPRPLQRPWPNIVYATSSEGGFKFVAEQCDEAFIVWGDKKNATSKRLKQMAADNGRSIKTQTLVTLVLGETEAEARRTMEHIRDGADYEAIAAVYDR